MIILTKMALIVDCEQFKQAMSNLPTGVTIVTSYHNNMKFGFTASSVTSVSLSPPLILFCIGKQSFSFDAFINSKYFAVSILSEDQAKLSIHFAKSDYDKFTGVSYNLGQYSNCPLIEGAVCYIECNNYNQYEAGDHFIVIGEVINTVVKDNLNPLIHCLRQYRKLKL